MKIDLGKFILESRNDRFDVIELRQVEKLDPVTREKTGEVKEQPEIVCNDMRLESAVRYVIDRRLNDQDITVSLVQYLDLFKKEREKITTLLK